MTDTDALSSFSEEEIPDDKRLRFHENNGWIKLNDKVVVKRAIDHFTKGEF